MITIYMLCGPIGAGKSTFAETLASRIRARILRTSDKLPGTTRLEKQEQGDIMDKMTKGDWVQKAVLEMKPTEKSPIIIDSIRNPMQVTRIQEHWPRQSILIGVRTQNLAKHIEGRKLSVEETKQLIQALQHPLEQQGAQLMPLCDIIFDNTRFKLEDILP